MELKIQEADLNNQMHQNAIVNLLNLYALDLQGYNKKLPEKVLDDLIPEIRKIPTAIVFLASIDKEFVGMAICFIGFSTFYARPLINIHDFTVKKEFRRRGIGTKLVDVIQEKANQLNCCKLTLEVQEKNFSALNLYENCGFEKAILDESEGRALFLSKYLSQRL